MGFWLLRLLSATTTHRPTPTKRNLTKSDHFCGATLTTTSSSSLLTFEKESSDRSEKRISSCRAASPIPGKGIGCARDQAGSYANAGSASDSFCHLRDVNLAHVERTNGRRRHFKNATFCIQSMHILILSARYEAIAFNISKHRGVWIAERSKRSPIRIFSSGLLINGLI